MKQEELVDKIAALMHDPPAKFDARWYRGARNGHEGFAAALRALLDEAIAGEQGAARLADRWEASADRPQLGTSRQVQVLWRPEGLITHPLAARPLSLLSDAAPPPRKVLQQVQDATQQGLDAFVRGPSLDAQAEEAFWWLWRRWRSWLGERPPAGVDPSAWERLITLAPADTRCPDHSLWDHLRLSSALAWGPRPDQAATSPWLLELAIGPVGVWLREARTTRDLWTASMLLSEVSLAAMQPIIERFGPDAIVYPDLARNARFDREIAARPGWDELLAEHERRARTRAALIPNRWLALVRGDRGELEALGEACCAAGRGRWRAIGREVCEVMLQQPLRWGEGQELTPENKKELRRAWHAHVEREGELHLQWAARPWVPPTPDAVDAPPVPPPSLPGQTGRREGFERWAEASRARWARVGPTIALSDRLRYDKAREVYRRTGGDRLLGFDYAPIQHGLKAALSARKLARPIPLQPLQGDACTACGSRPALGTEAGGRVNDQRKRAAGLWRSLAVDLGWDDAGEERLCGVCATRRFFVSPWKDRQPGPEVRRFYAVWSRDDAEGLPMPSTAAIAAGPYLAWLHQQEGLAEARRAVLEAARAVRWPQTFYPRSLHAVGGSLRDPGDRFSWLEPTILFDGPRRAQLLANLPEGASEAERERAAHKEGQLKVALDQLRRKGEGPAGPVALSSRFAVITVDGDHLGKLLLGAADQIVARWRDVLHPDVARQLHGDAPWQQAWQELLDEPRLMGPSLHAFINRVVTTFANRVVPWVVEREYAGRLVYAGGDDVLALAPAAHALDIAARLQELWSAAWVVDTRPHEPAWDGSAPWQPDDDRRRFQVVQAVLPAQGELLPMLGEHQSLSAGIAYAHFKTPLQLVVEAARGAQSAAKQSTGHRGACAEVLFTRAGAKYGSLLRWGAVEAARRVRRAFEQGELPGRLPYKLRASPLPRELEGWDRLARGALRLALDGGGEGYVADLLQVWSEEPPDGAWSNLLLARGLANHDEEEG